MFGHVMRARRHVTLKCMHMSTWPAHMGTPVPPTEKKWRVAPLDEDAWRTWIVNEIERNGFDPSVRDVFFSVGKDGTLWKSGAGTPNWMKIIEELPTGGLSGV